MASPVTVLLQELPAADQPRRKQILDRVVAALSDQLREQAARRMANEPSGHVIQATALVGEFYVKLLQSQLNFEDRQHFLIAAGRMMRNIIVDEARRFRAVKRWGGQRMTALDYHDAAAAAERDPDTILDLNNALAALAPEDAQLVELKFFYGLTLEETAEAMGIQYETLRKRWVRVRRQLYKKLGAAETDESTET